MAKRPDNWNKMSPEDRALWEYINAGEEFNAGGAPQFSAGEALDYENLDPNQLAQIRGTAYDDISTDPMLRNAQLDALRQLEEQANTGFTARDEADMAKLRADVNRTNRGRVGAIQQNMAARGMSGSGLDMVAQMQAAQDATEREALASLEQNAQMLDRKNQAVMQRGQMSGAMRDQDFNQAARKAEARDAINRFNTANQVNAQIQNNQGRNNVNAQNWNRTNQTSDRNTQAGYDFRKDQLGVGQNNAQMAYNKATDDYNRAQLKKQQKAARKAGMMSGVMGAAGAVAGGVLGSAAGPMGTMAGASAGYQAGGALGNAFGNFARGGKVPGQAPFPGDNEMNDIFPAMLSPGEVVLPRTVADDPFEAARFVSEQNLGGSSPKPSAPMSLAAKAQPAPYKAPNSETFAAKPIPEPILNKLAETQPDLVKQYRDRVKTADADLQSAGEIQGYLGVANMAGKALSDFSNSQKQDVILKNRMQDLGKAPEVSKAERKEYDGSMLDRLGAMGVQRAKDARAKVDTDYAAEQKLNLDDPNSSESAQARDYLRQLAPGVAEKLPNFDKLSASQIQKVAPGLFDKYKMDVSERNADKRLQAQISADDRRAQRADEKNERDMTFKLSKTYEDDDVTKRTTEIRMARKQAEALSAEPSPTNDIALVFAYMRSNDPRSTVREGEYAMAAQSGSLPQKWQAIYEQAKQGLLPIEARKNMVKTIQTNADAQEQMQQGRDAHYAEQAAFYKVNPDLVIGKRGQAAPASNKGSGTGQIKSAKDLP